MILLGVAVHHLSVEDKNKTRGSFPVSDVSDSLTTHSGSVIDTGCQVCELQSLALLSFQNEAGGRLQSF